jgi:hypothetical protein
MTRVYRFKTEAGFHKAMSYFSDSVIRWWGEDHCWAIEVRVI